MTRGRRSNSVGGALEEVAEEQSGFLRVLHREVDVLRLEHGRVRRLAACVADVRETRTDCVGCRCRALAEAMRCLGEISGGLMAGRCIGCLQLSRQSVR